MFSASLYKQGIQKKLVRSGRPATKAGKREVFGRYVMVKAKSARKIVKAFLGAALKVSI